MALPPDASNAELRHRPLLSACERCSVGPQRPGESNALDDEGAADNTSRHACIFCQEITSDSYVPIHLLRARSRGCLHAEDGAADLLRENSDAFIDSSASTDAALEQAPYSEALKSHRGCAGCWKKWEMRQVQLHSAGKLAVKCPVCNLLVDIRKTYGDIMCRSCQKAVVARGGNWRVWMGQKMLSAGASRRCQAGLALTVLCMFFGLQSLFSMVFWEICQESLHKRTNSSESGGYPIQNPLQILLEPWLAIGPVNASNATRRAGRATAAAIASLLS